MGKERAIGLTVHTCISITDVRAMGPLHRADPHTAVATHTSIDAPCLHSLMEAFSSLSRSSSGLTGTTHFGRPSCSSNRAR